MFNILKFKSHTSKFLSALKVLSIIQLPKFNFSQCHAKEHEIYPNDIIDNLKHLVKEHSKDQSEWNDLDYQITDKIHFFDADQYTDIVYLLCKHSHVSDNLWDLLSRKIFDYDLNEFQTLQLFDSFTKLKERKIVDNAYTPLIRNFIKIHNNKTFLNYYEKITH